MQSVKTDRNYTLLLRGIDKSDREFTDEQISSKGGVLGKAEELWDSCESWPCFGLWLELVGAWAS